MGPEARISIDKSDCVEVWKWNVVKDRICLGQQLVSEGSLQSDNVMNEDRICDPSYRMWSYAIDLS